ncbi:MAG: hypothetical protein KAT65_10720 [Methanophagales archaeon]|nr:hypothetical protein [Methanophagales archaeon]
MKKKYFNDDGICLIYSNNNTLVNNNASYNEWSGIWLWHSFNNSIANNIANSNSKRWGIGVEHSFNNKIYLNNFINNTNNVYSYSSTIIWNSPEKIIYIYNSSQYTNYLGNYWSDYTGSDADGDGFGDASYDLPGTGDYHPLMELFENYPEAEAPPCEPAIEVNKTVFDPVNGTWVEKIHDAEISQTYRFRCEVHNNGTCCNLTNIAVIDTLSDSLEHGFLTRTPCGLIVHSIRFGKRSTPSLMR